MKPSKTTKVPTYPPKPAGKQATTVKEAIAVNETIPEQTSTVVDPTIPEPTRVIDPIIPESTTEINPIVPEPESMTLQEQELLDAVAAELGPVQEDEEDDEPVEVAKAAPNKALLQELRKRKGSTGSKMDAFKNELLKRQGKLAPTQLTMEEEIERRKKLIKK